MNNFLARFSLSNLEKSLKQSFLAFPLSFVLALIIFALSFYMVYMDFSFMNSTKDILVQIIISALLVYILSIWVYFIAKTYNLSRWKTCLAQIFSISFWIWFYLTLPQIFAWYNMFEEDFLYIFLTFLGTLAFLYVSKFIHSYTSKNLDNDSYYSFFNEMTWKIAMSFIVWFLSMFLWFLALFSVFSLFDLSEILKESKFYWYWAIFSFYLLTPIYFLIQLSWEQNNDLTSEIRENKFYNFLNNYLIIPFIILYFIILYSYTIKVLLNFSNWPEGIISWMIIWFSLFWYLAFIFSYAFEEKLSMVRIFRKYFPIAVILQTPMLFYAIYLRINQYDFTINRYLVVILWIYLVIISFYFVLSKKKYIGSIPALLSFFIIIISVWPWSVYSFPEARQVSLLENNLREVNILQWNTIVLPKSKNDVDKNIARQIAGEIEYLCSVYSCESIKVFKPIVDKIKENHKKEWEKSIKNNESSSSIKKDYVETEYSGISYWEIKQKLLEELKIEAYYNYSEEDSEYIRFRFNYSNAPKIANIKWYDYFINLSNDYLGEKEKKIENLVYDVKADFYNKKVFVYKDSKILEEFDISTEIDFFYKKNINNLSEYSEIKIDKAFEIDLSWKIVDLKIYSSYFDIKNPEYKEKKSDNTDSSKNIIAIPTSWNSINWYALLKIK